MNVPALRRDADVDTRVATPTAVAHDADDARVDALSQWVAPLSPATPVLQVGERFLDAQSAPWLSLPVVDDVGQPLGCVSRYDLMQRVYIKPFGRELYGKRAIGQIMHVEPLVLAADATIEEAGRYIAARMRAPITEDFIVVDADGRYSGAGKVLDLLGALERRVSAHSQELEGAYRKLQSSQHQLIQSEKMASLGQMVAGIAHEMNTPLGYVRNNVEMTRGMLDDIRVALTAYAEVVDGIAGGADPAQFDSALLRIEAAQDSIGEAAMGDLAGMLDDTLFGVDQIAELVASLKDFSRRDALRTEEADVHRLIENALRIGGSVLRKRNVEVERQYGVLPPIVCAQNQINQVLLNLISNAAQAIEHDAGRIVIRTHASAHFVLIAIEDNGKGIDAAHVKRIFDPFFTTKPVGQGTGLGLSICYQIVDQHGGRIRVSSTPGAGSRFTVALPVRGDAPRTGASDPSPLADAQEDHGDPTHG